MYPDLGVYPNRHLDYMRTEQLYSTVQYSAVQYSTVQYSTVQYSTVQYSTVQYSTVQCHGRQASGKSSTWTFGLGFERVSGDAPSECPHNEGAAHDIEVHNIGRRHLATSRDILKRGFSSLLVCQVFRDHHELPFMKVCDHITLFRSRFIRLQPVTKQSSFDLTKVGWHSCH